MAIVKPKEGQFQCKGCLSVLPDRRKSKEFPQLCGGCGRKLHAYKNPLEQSVHGKYSNAQYLKYKAQGAKRTYNAKKIFKFWAGD